MIGSDSGGDICSGTGDHTGGARFDDISNSIITAALGTKKTMKLERLLTTLLATAVALSLAEKKTLGSLTIAVMRLHMCRRTKVNALSRRN